MIRHVLGSRASIGGPLGSGRGGAAEQWWLAAGVTPIAAYAPKGAASLADSYDNNAAPGNGLADGTYDAAPGNAPSFDTATGWTFAAASTQYLTANSLASVFSGEDKAMSFVIRMTYTSFVDFMVPFGFGSSTDGDPIITPIRLFNVSPRKNTAFLRDNAGTGTVTLHGNTTITTGTNYVFAATTTGTQLQLYIDGATDSALTAANIGTLTLNRFTIGAFIYQAASTGTGWLNGKISSIWIGNTTLSAAQVATQSAAMP